MGPRSFQIQIRDLKIWSALTKMGVPYNFCFMKFSPNWTVETAEAPQTPFRAPLTLGVGAWGRIPAMNLSAIEEYPHAKLHWDRLSGLDFYTGYTRTHTHTHTHIRTRTRTSTNTHWLLYIRYFNKKNLRWKVVVAALVVPTTGGLMSKV